MACVKILSPAEISEYQETIGKIYLGASDVYFVIDGLKITLEQSGNDAI